MIQDIKDQLEAMVGIMDQMYGAPRWSVYLGAWIAVLLILLPVLYIVYAIVTYTP